MVESLLADSVPTGETCWSCGRLNGAAWSQDGLADLTQERLPVAQSDMRGQRMAKQVNLYGAAYDMASPHEVNLQELAACSMLWSPEGPFSP